MSENKRPVYIVMGADSDQVHTVKGCNWLDVQHIPWKSLTAAYMLQPEELVRVINELKSASPRVVIVIAPHSTGLPGIIAGGLREEKTLVFGVRSSVPSGPSMTEDGTFNVSALPAGVNVAYCGFNNPGFASACELAAKLL